jgi:hypothetical protein
MPQPASSRTLLDVMEQHDDRAKAREYHLQCYRTDRHSILRNKKSSLKLLNNSSVHLITTIIFLTFSGLLVTIKAAPEGSWPTHETCILAFLTLYLQMMRNKNVGSYNFANTDS